MASLKRIAAEVGVTYTLVSKVLRGRLGTTGVSDKTRNAILAKARELNYMPNRLAVALKAGRKGTVAVFLHHCGLPGSEVAGDLLRGLADALEECGLHMWLRFFESREAFVSACNFQLGGLADGVISAGIAHPELVPKFRELEKGQLPVVCAFNEMLKGGEGAWTNVAPDVELQGYLPTRHMLELGARRIACLATTEGRTRGYRRALREAGVRIAPKLVIPCPKFGLEQGTAAAGILLEGTPRVEGIVCQSDAQAVGVVNELVKRGVRVPGDILVSGVDDSPLAQACLVPITSVTSEMLEVGRNSVHALLEKIEGRAVQSITLKPRLVVRESTRREIG